mmetsp:Transcript_22588/g.42131  ORF Transcript_22588/g.42131 Transcript_22588/m.42131 type:complete len:101 (+) Transcript_22588:1-303(+)
MTSFNYDDDGDDGDGDDGDVVDGTGERCGCCPWNSGRCGLGRGCGISQHNKKLFVSEVKSTNDRMSIWQLAWKELLHSASVPFEEAHVNWKKNAKKAAWR